MKGKKTIRKGLYGIVAGAMVITSTFTGVHAATKVETLLANMTLEEKAAQIMQVDVRWATPKQVAQYQFGSILAGGGAAPSSGNSMSDWATRADQYQKAIVDANKIPLLYGVDAVHGNNNVKDATMFPHNIGLAAANDESLTRKVGQAAASEVKATGSNWTFTPTIGVPHNERWGRTYETFGDDYKRVSTLGNAYIQGIQDKNIFATAKHYLGEGLTTNGTNQGNVEMSEADYKALVNADMSNATVKELLTPYKTAINNGVKSIMVTYNSFNGVKTHGNYDLVTTLLRNKLGFKGVVVSDYNGLDQISSYIDENGKKQTASTYKEKAVACVNTGVDLLMVAEDGNWQKLYAALVEALEDGSISEKRINEACTRILNAKDDLGLLDGQNLYSSSSDQKSFGQEEHREIAREAVAKSLTLLKNTQMNDTQTIMQQLQNMKKVVVAGSNGNNIGNQCGGWTITWQGDSGNTTKGTTIYQGIKDNLTAKGGNAYYAANGYFDQDVEAAIVVAGEKPYAESNGDSSASQLKLSSSDIKVINTIKEDHPDLPIILVLVTGRPLTIADQVKDDSIQAIVSAWLPGTEGAGVADVLFGEQDFTGTNPITWPWYAKDITSKLTDSSKVLYQTGYGLKKAQASDKAEKPDDPDVLKLKTEGTTRLEAETFYDSYSASDQIKLENNDTTVGNLRVGSYLLYKISTEQDAVYDLVVNANANENQANAFQLYIDDKLILDNTMTVPGVGDWTTFKPLDLGSVSIPKGEHVLKLLAKTKDFNLDYFDFTVDPDKEYVAPQEPEAPKENIGTGAILEEGAVQVSMSSSENSGSRDWYYGNQKIANKNTDKKSLDLRTVDDSTITTINVDDKTEYNSFLGMGTSIDESTINNLWKMNEEARYAFIKRLVDPTNGSGNTLFRLTIGTADFTAKPFYTYYDGTGTELNGKPDWYNETGKGFSIQKDIDYHIIETIQLIQKAAKECGVEDQIKFFASPWTPPGWMKTATNKSNSYKNNELLLKGGKLSDDHIQDAAKYYVRYIEEYAKLNIPIYAMTLQNEPMLEIDYPSCILSASQEAKLAAAIKDELSKSTVLTDAQKDVKVWAFDHNPGDLNTYMNEAYDSNKDAIDGAAVHDYGGELSNMTTLHNNYDDKSIHLTERSVWGTTGMDRIIQYYRNYAESYNCWVTMLDSNIATHQWVGTPDPTAFVQDANDPDSYWSTPEVYLMSQFSKYIRPGYIRVQSNYGSSNTITNVVFKNPETNELVMVAVNNTDQDQAFKVVNNGVQFNATLPAKNCATYIWKASDNAPIGLDIPGTLTPQDAKAVSGMNQGENFENVTDGAQATYLINVKETGYYDIAINHSIGSSGYPWANNDNMDDKTIILMAEDGKVLGKAVTNRFDTWSGNYADWSDYKFIHMRVYLNKGVQNITLKSEQGNINIGNLIFTKVNENTIPGFINAVEYTYGEGVVVENNTNIGFFDPEDVLEYNVKVQKAGSYDMKLNYGAANPTDFNIYLDDQLLASNVKLEATGGWSEWKNSSIEKLKLTEGEHTIRFVPNKDGGFNLKSFSFGPYMNVSVEGDTLTEGSLKGREINVQLTDGQFVKDFNVKNWSLEGLPEGTSFEVIRVSDTQATIKLTSEAPQDFDSPLNVKVCMSAKEIGDDGYVLSDYIEVKAINDPESLSDITIEKGVTSFKVELEGGTFNKDITKDDIELSDSLSKYLTIESVSVNEEGSLVVLVKRVDNYVDIQGTLTVKMTGYSDSDMDLECNVTLKTNAIPTPIEVGLGYEGKLDHSYDSNGTIADAVNGNYESYYIDVKEAGDYVLAFDITNAGEMNGALSINGGLGLFSTNNLASISFGNFWSNSNVSYKTLLHFDEAGLYTIQLKANNTFKLTNATLTSKPSAIDLEDKYTFAATQIIDGSDDKLWAIEKVDNVANNVGYTGTDAYQDYLVNVKEDGQYKFSLNYSTEGSDSVAGLFSVVNGKEISLGTIDLTSTGGWSTYQDSKDTEVTLSKGEQILRLKVTNGGFNVKTMTLEKVSKEPVKTIEPVITCENNGRKVYVNTQGSLVELLGIKVMYDDQDITNDSARVSIQSEFDITKAGKYTVQVIAKNSEGEDVTQELTIEVINVPTMEYDNSKIVVNSEFDPMSNIIVKDYDGKDLTDQVKIIENNVDLSKEGTYTIIYSVVNGLNDTFTFERQVVVIEEKKDDPKDQKDDNKKPIVNNDKKDDKKDDQKQKVPGIIKTGDDINITPYMLLGTVALFGIFYGSKKRKENNI